MGQLWGLLTLKTLGIRFGGVFDDQSPYTRGLASVTPSVRVKYRWLLLGVLSNNLLAHALPYRLYPLIFSLRRNNLGALIFVRPRHAQEPHVCLALLTKCLLCLLTLVLSCIYCKMHKGVCL